MTEPNQQDYLVTWSINVQASSPEVAAWIAQGIAQDLDSTATVFVVRAEGSDEAVEIDLDALDGEGL
jgi:hypothetical protein